MRLGRAEHGAGLSPASFDVVVVTDLRFPGGTSSSLVDEITAATAAGYRIGLVHLANSRLGRSLPVHAGLRALLDGGRAHLLLPGEPARARLGMVKHPMVFASWTGGRFPIEVDRVLVAVGQVPADHHDVYYDAEVVDRHVTEAFGHRPVWAPVSPTVRAALSGVEQSDDDWVEVIDLDAWSRGPEAGRRTRRAPDRRVRPPIVEDPPDHRPVIGRHSRPDPLKWPATAGEILAAYPADGSVRVRILGGADAAVDLLGEVPEQWEVLPFGSVTAQEFLAGLDAFVYFHHPDLTEAFGRTILEAIAAGVPAVVPAHFEPLFGDACLYATPATAVATVQALLADPEARRRHVERARAIAEERFGHAAHVARLAALVGPPARDTGGPAAPPRLDLAPTEHHRAVSTTMIVALGAKRREVKALLRRLDTQRRQAVGFVPVLVVSITRPPLADELGIETAVITSRRSWTDTSESWETYAQRRLRQLVDHYAADSIAVADPGHPDAWIALHTRSASATRPAMPEIGEGRSSEALVACPRSGPEMTIDDAPVRPWHVSAAMLTDMSTPGRTVGDGAETWGVVAPAAGRPLWRRIVTGQVIGWRIRLLLARLLRVRRSAARRALAWLDRHSEFHDVLADQGPVGFARFTLSFARAARTTIFARPARPARRTRYRPAVDAPSGLDINGLRGSVALDGVELSPALAVGTSSRAEFSEPLIELHIGGRSGKVDNPGIRLLDAVDISIWNPKWFRRSPDPHAVQLGELPGGRTRRAARARARTAGRARLVVCGDTGNVSDADTAQHLAQLAMSGLPVVGDIADDVAEYLGADLATLIRATPAADLADGDCRERYSIALRRAAFRTFSPQGRWRLIGAACGQPVTATPSVTVLLASNRPDDVVGAARQVAAQGVGSVQLVVGLHGSHMSPELDEQLAECFAGDLVVRHFPVEMNLGQVLNALTAEADGDLVTKWDDDDWYDSRHLADLVAALEYSGADMVAKAAEFVYLESLDLTVRRFATGSERFSTTVAGGTLLLTRAELQQVGWVDAPRRVDRLLIEALEDRSRKVYRTHGFGYVLRRRGDALGQHTWHAGDAYFLRQSVDQRSGLDLTFAGFDEPSSTEVAP